VGLFGATIWVVRGVGVWYNEKEPAGVARLVSYASRVLRLPSGLSPLNDVIITPSVPWEFVVKYPFELPYG